MLQFLPMIMSLIQGKQKDAQARKQNEISAMMGQAPTADTGNTAAGLGNAMQMLNAPKSLQTTGIDPESAALKSKVMGSKMGPYGERHNGLSASTDNLLDEALGGEPDNDEDDLLGG